MLCVTYTHIYIYKQQLSSLIRFELCCDGRKLNLTGVEMSAWNAQQRQQTNCELPLLYVARYLAEAEILAP